MCAIGSGEVANLPLAYERNVSNESCPTPNQPQHIHINRRNNEEGERERSKRETKVNSSNNR